MARRPDFAQKLLDDLRLRKECLASAQGGSRNAHSSGDAYVNSRQMIRSSTNAKGSVKYSLTHNRAIGCQKPPESSKQRITDSSRNQNPMLSFLREMGRGSMDVSGRRSVKVQVLALSQLHVKEISKGAEKLNRILRAWSSGLNFDQCSVEIGKQLLKGAIDLKESLWMLANIQEASMEFSTWPQQKNRIELLEDGKGDDASFVESNGGNKIKQIEPPRFSFDKPSRRNRGIQKSVTAAMNTGLPALSYPDESLKFSISISNPVKERKNNVIAKLMGLEELPEIDEAASNSPPWLISPSIQVERATKSPLSQEISRMMMGLDRRVVVPPDTRAAKVESIKRLYSTKPEKSNLTRNDLKANDGRLKEQRIINKPIRTEINRKHEQGMTRKLDRRGPKDQKSARTTETALRPPHGKLEMAQELRNKGGNSEGKPQVDDKKGSTVPDNSQRKRGDMKHGDKNGPENQVTAKFTDRVRTKEYKGMEIERMPEQVGGAQGGQAWKRKEIPSPVLPRTKVVEHFETRKFQVMKEDWEKAY